MMFQHGELTRDVYVNLEIIRYLGTKLEEAKYREALNTPTIQVLDRAVVPTLRSAPRRTLIVVASVGLALFLSTVLAFVFDSWSRLESSDRATIESIRELLRR